MTGSGKRSMRGQLLLNQITFAQNAAMRDDYLNAVTFLRGAARAVGYNLPQKPFGTPDIVRGDVWKKYRTYFHSHYETVAAHVDEVLNRLSQAAIGVSAEDGAEDD